MKKKEIKKKRYLTIGVLVIFVWQTFVWQNIAVAQAIAVDRQDIAVDGEEYPYCEFGRNPYNPNRQLEPGEVWVQAPAAMGPIISLGNGGTSSKPCIVPKGTLLGAKKTEGGKYCEPWVKICGNPLLLLDGRSFCFWVKEPTPTPNTPTPPPAPIPAPEPNTSTTVKVEPSTIKVEPSTIKVEVEVKQAQPAQQPATPPDSQNKNDSQKDKKGKIALGAAIAALVLGGLIYALSQQGDNGGGGHGPGGGTVPPGGGGPPGGGTLPP